MNTSPLSDNRENAWRNVFFIGAGGIGMTNLERYCLSRGQNVAGYDRTPSELTDTLRAEGADIFFTDDPELIPEPFRNPADTLAVYTPAVPADNRVLSFFRQGGFRLIKRAAFLGDITRSSKGICVAGSHGKTTVSSMTAHILDTDPTGCNAFLGGILRNNNSNLILSPTSPWSVIEADEYDRSFHHLSPFIAVITSTDPDHLDIYGDEAGYLEAFRIFSSLIRPGGTLILHTGLKMKPDVAPGVNIVTYSASDRNAQCRAENVSFEQGHLFFDLVTPWRRIDRIEIGVPVEINVDNAVAAATAAMLAGASDESVRQGLKTFLGAKRRFEFHLRPENGKGTVLIDDYAHSPNEVRASIASVRRLYPDRKLTVIFQPHLYTRTRDFAADFADALSGADEVIMPEIYPAREKPIPGVDSGLILKDVRSPEKMLCEREDLLNLIKKGNFEVLMTLGAADIDRLLPEMTRILEEKEAGS